MIERMAAGMFVLLLILSASGPDPTPKPLSEYEILATAAAIQTRNARQSRPGTKKIRPHGESDWQATDAASNRQQATEYALYADELATERAATIMAEVYATDIAMLTEEAAAWLTTEAGYVATEAALVATRFPDHEPDGPCDPHYPTVCIPPYPPDLDCRDVPQYADFEVRQPDPHHFDDDLDGRGCEWNN